jgi:hypothetical protein
MKETPLFRKAGMILGECPLGEDAIFDFGLTPERGIPPPENSRRGCLWMPVSPAGTGSKKFLPDVFRNFSESRIGREFFVRSFSGTGRGVRPDLKNFSGPGSRITSDETRRSGMHDHKHPGSPHATPGTTVQVFL